MSTKISLDDVKSVINGSNVSEQDRSQIILQLQQRLQEIEEDKAQNKKEREKTQYIGLVSKESLIDNESDGMGWVLKVPEDFELLTLKSKIISTIRYFNENKRKGPDVKSLSDAFLYIPAKLWKQEKIKIVTKESVYFTNSNNITILS